MVRCPYCDADITSEVMQFWKYCAYCGAELYSKCPNCGEMASSIDQMFCDKCGAVFKSEG